MYFVDGPDPVPLGIYNRPSETVGVLSVEVPAGWLSRILRDATRFTKGLEEAIPNAGWRFVVDLALGD